MIKIEISVPKLCMSLERKKHLENKTLFVAHGFNVPTLFTTEFSDSQLKFEDSWVKHFELFKLLLLFFMYTISEVVFSC